MLKYGEEFNRTIAIDWKDYPSKDFVINDVITRYKKTSYLEIGCAEDKNFSAIYCDKKIGVDPNSRGTHKMTSDKFFKDNKDTFDVIFIDGLHTKEQVSKDISNSLECLNSNGIFM